MKKLSIVAIVLVIIQGIILLYGTRLHGVRVFGVFYEKEDTAEGWVYRAGDTEATVIEKDDKTYHITIDSDGVTTTQYTMKLTGGNLRQVEVISGDDQHLADATYNMKEGCFEESPKLEDIVNAPMVAEACVFSTGAAYSIYSGQELPIILMISSILGTIMLCFMEKIIEFFSSIDAEIMGLFYKNQKDYEPTSFAKMLYVIVSVILLSLGFIGTLIFIF